MALRRAVPAMLLALVALAAFAFGGCNDNSLETIQATLVAPPNVPPKPNRGAAHVVVNLEAREEVKEIAPGVNYDVWSFNGSVPAPLIRVQVGDTVEVRLKNDATNKVTHNIDLHAVNGPGGGAEATNVAPGEERAFTFKPLAAGLFTYHCAQGIVADHIANGMYGAILVERPGSRKVADREYYMGQSEFYLTDENGPDGIPQLDYDKLLAEQPTYVAFNGNTKALVADHALPAQVGDKIRMYVTNGGPNFTMAFHIIGEILDRVYAWGSLANDPLEDIQTISVPPGGATIADLTINVPGDYKIVDHAISRISKGALGIISATGENNFDVFRDLQANPIGGPTATPEGEPTATPSGSEPTATQPAAQPTATPSPVVEETTVELDDILFVQDSLTAKAGTQLKIDLQNIGLLPHNMHIADASGSYNDGTVSEPQIINGGDQGTLTWNVPNEPGTTYNFRCDVHPAQMTGTITIE